MINMSTQDATNGIAVVTPPNDPRPGRSRGITLDLIDEYLMENKARESAVRAPACSVLPGPPPPPQDGDLQELSPVTRPRQSQPMLVARGSAPQPLLPCPLSQVRTSSMASPLPNLGSPGGASRRSRGAERSRATPARPGGGRGVAHQGQTGTEILERLLDKPVLEIVEHPKERGMRFRYECEGRSAGSILGASSTEATKTLPAVEVKGSMQQVKKIKITVSLVTKDIPHRPHPHSLVGKDCNDGICVVRLNPRVSCRHSFSNLGIQCVRRKELDTALEKRRNQKIDPFNTGHSKSIEDIDMNVVRLCFQCELEREDGEKITLSPVVSNPIYDKKATTTSELKINRLNVVRGPCTGKTEIYLLCDKVQKDDIEIIFSKGKWEAKAEFAQTDVHRQIAVVFKSPPYQEQDITEEVEVNVFLRRLSDHMDSEPVKFTYVPHNPDPYEVNRKRKLKTDIKFNERCSVTAQSMTAPEPSTSHQFPQFPYVSPSDSAHAVATPPQELVPPQPGQAMEEIHYPASMDVKQEDNLCPSMDMFNSEDFQHIFTGISQILDSTGIPFSQLGLPGMHEQPPSQGYAFSDVGHSVAFNQDPNSNYSLANLDQNFNVPGDRAQPDVEFYNDVRFPQYNSQLVNGTHGLPVEPLPQVLPGPAPQVLQPCDGEDSTLLYIKVESHIDL
ncbi:hypothetical protein MATL_G00118210 [Megalops atlanticus]|uniref:RHD domain-containing protein n=1 Tax=Megalops atlanticus TaxID=7932 RepID=A0A9D3PX64_MEGAT|nr:hypothetical protein MATL_G00118210 [Megalops atlanticus]